MPDFVKRIAAPAVFGALALLAVITMVSDRRSLEVGGRDLPWYQALMLEVAVPIQDLVGAPVDFGISFLAVVWIGIYPAPLLEVVEAASRAILPGG